MWTFRDWPKNTISGAQENAAIAARTFIQSQYLKVLACELAFAMSGKEALANCKGPVKIGNAGLEQIVRL